MITQQVVTYIKEQLSRSVPREKIRTNLIAAGWQASDIEEAFSFAEPNKPSASVSIAPTFAVPSQIREEKPVDKTILTEDINPVMPILKKDNPVSSTLSNNPFLNPEQKISVMPNVGTGNLDTPASVQPVAVQNPVSQSGINTRVSTKKGSSLLLKIIVFVLFVILIAGNAYLWLGFSNLDNSDTDIVLNTQADIQSEREVFLIEEQLQLQNDVSLISPAEELLIPATNLQNAAAEYFSKNNTYGGVVMALGACNTAGTVFSDNAVRVQLESLSSITGRVAQCALFGSTVSNQTRTTSYMVYIPMEDAGYCIDSSGATLIVPTAPEGASCATGF